jgi:hypothetical protein
VRVPEPPRPGSALGQLGGAAGDIAARHRPVAKDITQTFAESVAQFGDTFVGRAAMGTGIAAVLNNRDLGPGRTQNVIARRFDRAGRASFVMLPLTPRSSLTCCGDHT